MRHGKAQDSGQALEDLHDKIGYRMEHLLPIHHRRLTLAPVHAKLVERGGKEIVMQSISLPKQMVEKVLKVSLAFEDLPEELEDFLIAQQPALLRTLRRARREHLAGKTRPFIAPH